LTFAAKICFLVLSKDEQMLRGNSLWTGGFYDKQCTDSDLPIVWCPSKEYVSSKLSWRKGEPNKKTGDCVAIRMGVSDPGLFMAKCSTAYMGIGKV
jgi:hypothetical protein